MAAAPKRAPGRVSQLISAFNNPGSVAQQDTKAGSSTEETEDPNSKRYRGPWSFNEPPDVHLQKTSKLGGFGGLLGFSNNSAKPSKPAEDTPKEELKSMNLQKSATQSKKAGTSANARPAPQTRNVPIIDVQDANDGGNSDDLIDLTPGPSKLSKGKTAPKVASKVGPKATGAKTPANAKQRKAPPSPVIVVQKAEKVNPERARGRDAKSGTTPTKKKKAPLASPSPSPRRPRTADPGPKSSTSSFFGFLSPPPTAKPRSRSSDSAATSKRAQNRKSSNDSRPAPRTRHRRNLSLPDSNKNKIYSRKDSRGNVTLHVNKSNEGRELTDLEKSDWRASLAHRFVGDLY